MQEKIMTLSEIGEALGLSENTVRTYLDGYRFSNFYTTKIDGSRKKVAYRINDNFISELTYFLHIKKNQTALFKLKNFYEKENKNA